MQSEDAADDTIPIPRDFNIKLIYSQSVFDEISLIPFNSGIRLSRQLIAIITHSTEVTAKEMLLLLLKMQYAKKIAIITAPAIFKVIVRKPLLQS